MLQRALDEHLQTDNKKKFDYYKDECGRIKKELSSNFITKIHSNDEKLNDTLNLNEIYNENNSNANIRQRLLVLTTNMEKKMNEIQEIRQEINSLINNII